MSGTGFGGAVAAMRGIGKLGGEVADIGDWAETAVADSSNTADETRNDFE
ncbi:hypothetical protein GCM10011529_00060 [Polymorphobacter glacialis]|uniref:Uncharacterized protein n=1 Tax=Sandarakinorhabdus glacialis TaxID=1614636 RepID=A0A917E2S7_9SPHN|nr:hypothetical protein GCM10011529_00060 [Polymorphobacter glacialis]